MVYSYSLVWDGANNLTRRPVRILAANLPRLFLKMIITAFSDHPDMKMIGQLTDETNGPETAEKTKSDSVVNSLAKSGECASVRECTLRKRHTLRIIAISPRNEHSPYYSASPRIYSRDVETSETQSVVSCGLQSAT
jgi:hypothetical protein